MQQRRPPVRLTGKHLYLLPAGSKLPNDEEGMMKMETNHLVSPAQKHPVGICEASWTRCRFISTTAVWFESLHCVVFDRQVFRRRTLPRPSRCVCGQRLAVWVQQRGWSTSVTADLQTQTSARPSESDAPTSASRSSDARSPDTNKRKQPRYTQ